MSKKRVKGLVLEHSGKTIVLLTRDGDFLRVPVRGFLYAVGMEVEVDLPPKRKPLFTLSAVAVAAALFLAVALYLIQPQLTAPEAYLALDINPGVVFTLDKDAVVTGAKAINEDGEEILRLMKVVDVNVLEVLDAFLDVAYKNNFLAVEKDNVIIISLAAPENFVISEDDLRTPILEQLFKLEVDSYLKITVTGLDKVEEGERLSIPLNALILGEEMRQKMKDEESRALLEGSPPLPVREFLQTVKPADIFGEDEFVPGEGRKKGRKPDSPAPPLDITVPKSDDGAEKGPAGNVNPGKPADIPKPPSPRAEQKAPVNPNRGNRGP